MQSSIVYVFPVDVTYHSLATAANELLWLTEYIKNQGLEYWGEERFYKLVVPDMLSRAGISRVIILDTDVLVLGHLHRLWSLFDQFHREQIAGLVDDHLAKISLKPDRVYLISFCLYICDMLGEGRRCLSHS